MRGWVKVTAAAAALVMGTGRVKVMAMGRRQGREMGKGMAMGKGCRVARKAAVHAKVSVTFDCCRCCVW